MAYQFIHMECFSRKGGGKGRSVSYVLAEARRDPAASIHVPTPAPPVVVYGISPDQVERLHDDRADAAKTMPKGGKFRRIQRTQHTLMTVVASHPLTMDEVRADPTQRRVAEQWEGRTVAWLRDTYGDQLVSVIRHEDESHFHVHAYILPDDPAMRANGLHPGQVAKADVMAAGPADGEDSRAVNKRGDAAYKTAMRDWQDSYHRTVGIPCGLTRLGPAGRRLSRAEWQAEQVQATALRDALDRATAVKAKAEMYITATKGEAARIASEAAAAQAAAARQVQTASEASSAALRAQDRAVAEQRKAASMMARVRAEGIRVREAAARLRSLPGIVRGLWDGLRRSAVQDRIRRTSRPRCMSSGGRPLMLPRGPAPPTLLVGRLSSWRGTCGRP